MTDWAKLFACEAVESKTLCGLASVEQFVEWLGKPGVSREEHPEGVIVYVEKEGGEEVHVAFLPSAWGRRVAYLLSESFGRKMEQGVTLFAREQEGYFRSRPPKSHGWKVAGDFETSDHPSRLRRWILTPQAWYTSPVGRKYNVVRC